MSDVKLRIIYVTCFGTPYVIAVPQNIGSLWNICVSALILTAHTVKITNTKYNLTLYVHRVSSCNMYINQQDAQNSCD